MFWMYEKSCRKGDVENHVLLVFFFGYASYGRVPNVQNEPLWDFAFKQIMVVPCSMFE